MKKGQVTLDLLMAILISLFLITWLQGYIEIQATHTQTLGIHQETSQAAVSTGSIMNTFHALEPTQGDYSEITTPQIKNLLQEPTTTIEKLSTENEVTVTSLYDDNEATYSYPVQGNTTYHDNCTSTGGGSCVKR